MSRAVRRHNRRYHPVALERFDRALANYESARAEGARCEAASLAHDVETAHGMLIRPVPGWRKLLPGVAAIFAVSAVAVWVWWHSRPEAVSVTVVSAAGAANVTEVRRNGRVIAGLSGTVGELGRAWTLETGSYVVETSGGTVKFEVPGVSSVVLPGAAADYDEGLWKALERN